MKINGSRYFLCYSFKNYAICVTCNGCLGSEITRNRVGKGILEEFLERLLHRVTCEKNTVRLYSQSERKTIFSQFTFNCKRQPRLVFAKYGLNSLGTFIEQIK